MRDGGYEVTFDWALRSRRRPGDDGYEIVAGGGELALSRYEALVAPWLPGVPGRTAGSPGRRDALPWFWVAPGRADPERGLGLAVTTAGRDLGPGEGRADQTVYLHLPWTQIVEARTTYAEMAASARFWSDELARVVPPRGSSGRPRASLAPMNVVEQANLIKDFGLQRVAGIAALVIDGAVTLRPPTRSRGNGLVDDMEVGADGDIESRLRWFDAVAALLPYGYRADLALSTWSVPDAPHRLRFAEDGGRWQVPVDRTFQHPPKPPGAAEKYRSFLVELTARPHPLADVVECLAELTALRLDDGLGPVFDALRALDRPHQLWLAVADRRAVDLDQVREVLDDPDQLGRMSSFLVPDLARTLLDSPHPRDEDRLATHLVDAQLPFLVDAVRRVAVESGPVTPDAAWLMSVADRVGVKEDLLDALVRAPTRGLRLRRQEVRERVWSVVADALAPPDAGSWPQLRHTLLSPRRAETVYEIVDEQVAGPGGVAAAVRTMAWLTGDADPVPASLAPLNDLINSDPGDAAIDRALEKLPAVLGVRLATVRRGLASADALDLLLARRRAGRIDPLAVRAELERLEKKLTDVPDVVRMDLLGLLANGRPLRDLDRRLTAPLAPDAPDVAAAYTREFGARFWSLSDDERWAVSRPLAEHLGGRSGELSWAADEHRATAVITFLHHLRTPPAGCEAASWNPQHLHAAVADAVAAHRDLEQLEAYRTLWLGPGHDGAPAEAPPLDDPVAEIAVLKRVGDDLDPATFEARVARVLERGDDVVTDRLFDALRGSRHLEAGIDIRDFLIHVWQKLLPESAEDDDLYWPLVRRVHRGALGAAAARRHNAHVRKTGPAEFRRWSQELAEAGMPPEEIADLLHEVADETRRRGRPPTWPPTWPPTGPHVDASPSDDLQDGT